MSQLTQSAQSTQSKYVLIHKTVRNDDDGANYAFEIFDNKRNAAVRLIEEYYEDAYLGDITNSKHSHHIEELLKDTIFREKLIDHFVANDIMLFQWEWKRRSNYDKYWIATSHDGKYHFHHDRNGIKMKEIIEIVEDAYDIANIDKLLSNSPLDI